MITNFELFENKDRFVYAKKDTFFSGRDNCVLRVDTRYQVTSITSHNNETYYILKEFPNTEISRAFFLSEEEYNANKYNI